MIPPVKRMPIAAAKAVAEKYGMRQVVLLAWDGETAHAVTYGVTKADCASAAQAQDFWTGRIREFSFRGKDGGA